MNPSSTAPVAGGEEKSSYITESSPSVVSKIDPEIQIFDLYAVGYDAKKTVQPFIHELYIDTGIGGPIQVWANIDDGALANAMSTAMFNTIKHRLGRYKPSPRWLRMADGNIVKPKAVWEGKMTIGGVQVFGSFEVFESGGNWEFLLGKPLLTSLHAMHDYTTDTISIKNNELSTVLSNQIATMTNVHNKANKRRTTRHEQQRDLEGSEKKLPPREVETIPHRNDMQIVNTVHTENPVPHTVTNAYNCDTQANSPAMASEIKIATLKSDDNLYTRFTEPRKKERISEILKQVQIGSDLTEDERRKVQEFLVEWADVFALAVSEVRQVDNAVHSLDIPPGATFSTKVGQKPLTPPQRKYLYDSIDTMLKADIIEQCLPDQVKCVSPTTLAQKAHSNRGLNLEELQHRVNDECITHGFKTLFNLPPRSQPTPDDETNRGKPKWRICQNFAQINKVTKVAPMPQGDIRNNKGLVDTGGYQALILQRASTRLQWTRNHDPIRHSMSKEGDISGTKECHSV